MSKLLTFYCAVVECKGFHAVLLKFPLLQQSSQGGLLENGDASNMKKKKKEKAGKTPVYTSRPWNREDAEKALALENECQRSSQEQSLVIRFPDPELSKEVVKGLHPMIESVHFQAPSGARFVDNLSVW